MENAALVLLIVVSSILSVFLLLLSVALMYLIKVLKRASQVADDVESAASAIRRASALPVVGAFIKGFQKRR